MARSNCDRIQEHATRGKQWRASITSAIQSAPRIDNDGSLCGGKAERAMGTGKKARSDRVENAERATGIEKVALSGSSGNPSRTIDLI